MTFSQLVTVENPPGTRPDEPERIKSMPLPGFPETNTMIMELMSTRDIVWQFAFLAAFLHLVQMKIPQQADSALRVIWSGLAACAAVLLFSVWTRVSLGEGCFLLLLFNLTFVCLSSYA